VAKLDKLPLEAIVNDLKQALASVNQVLESADNLVASTDGKLIPELNSVLGEARRAFVEGVGSCCVRPRFLAVTRRIADIALCSASSSFAPARATSVPGVAVRLV
jgi:hypothetical protein